MNDFADLALVAALPRLTGLALSCDGSRLVAVLQQPDAKSSRYASSLWEIPLDGGTPARLTHSEQGESAPVFAPDGSLLFVSARPGGPAARPDADSDATALWCLPPVGEATVLARRAGGLGGPVVATASGTVVVAGTQLVGSRGDGTGDGTDDGTDDGTGDGTGDGTDDEQRRATRKDRRISAILHTGMPIRYWDHELGDESPRLFVLGDDGRLRDLAPDATHHLVETSYSVSADGTSVALAWRERRRGGRSPRVLALVDVATRARRVLAEADDVSFSQPVLSPDGARIALMCVRDGSFEAPPEETLGIVTTTGDRLRVELGDLFPNEWVWSADSRALFVSGDLHGRGAVVRVDPVTGAVEETLADDAVYTSLCVAPGGDVLYALRSLIDSPPTPVRLSTDTRTEAGAATPLPSPAAVPDLPGELVELSVTAPDGEDVHAWVCLPPPGDTPAPVMLWIHGGPFGSYNAWSWRWNPWIAVAHGWAVVLPDPAMSTGYGQRWWERAWPYVAAEVYADCEAVLDAVLDLPDVDPARVACLGASFGGYMTNWVAGHVDRFGAIVTHSGSYALDQQHKTTDAADYKTGIFATPAEHPQWYEDNSPHHGAVGTTPMLVIHGKRDFRVPFSESLRLWWDLVSGWPGEPETMPHRFLELTGENHWVLSPANAEIWWDALLGFCAEHVLGRPWTPSSLL